jgi:caffeoyl-CoA O-methyltransferase
MEAKSAGMPEISISPVQGLFLQQLLKAINARKVLEIGSLGGYSAITMAMALPDDGLLYAVEINKTYCDFIRRKTEESGFSERIKVINSSGEDFLRNLSNEEIFDFIFLDADKPGYINYVNLSIPHLRKGGIIAADNALAMGKISDESDDSNARAIHNFNLFMINNQDFFSSLVPIGDGLTLGLKL